MDVSKLLENLNPAQREAVAARAGNYLVLAGAGSGKTRVLIHRIAWLIEVMGVSPHAILAVTFTNKAAGEMRQRANTLLGYSARNLWVGTFHSIAHRLLRLHSAQAGLPDNFQILDSDDQYRLIRRIMRELKLDESHWPPRKAQWVINHHKDEGRRPDQIEPGYDQAERQWLEIYRHYDQYCRDAGLVDFAELLLRAHELLLTDAELLAHYQHRFSHLLVDEFQDTNTIQYAWVRLLTGENGCAFVVGDDDQSIYGWRGARVENVSLFQHDYVDVEVIRLEQNYRSTGTILSAANAVIAHNDGRLGKNLWTEDGEGDLIRVFAAHNEYDEADYVISSIAAQLDEGSSASDIAVLYRSNAQSRLLEEQLLRQRIPYRVYGGLRFFERAEIKDALAYLRLLASPDDNAAFERIINVPARGIGEKTLVAVRQFAAEQQLSLWASLRRMIEKGEASGRAASALNSFSTLIDGLIEACADCKLDVQLERILQHTELIRHYDREPPERREGREENLSELINAARVFTLPQEDEEAGMSELVSFLSHAALEAGEQQADEWEDCIQLMTLHSAKGLEFDSVYITGMEQGLFPHQMAVEEPGRYEEERRLCYVGITRARRLLHLTHAEARRWHGKNSLRRPSRFLKEIPPELVHQVRPVASVGSMQSSAVTSAQQDSMDGLRLGQMVEHPSFGTGVILDCEGSGDHTRIQINFDTVGSKWLVLSYANLTAL